MVTSEDLAAVEAALGRPVTLEDVAAAEEALLRRRETGKRVPCPIRRRGDQDSGPHEAWWYPDERVLDCDHCDFRGDTEIVRLAILDQMRAFEEATNGALVEPTDDKDLRPMRYVIAELVRKRVQIDIAMALAYAYDERRTKPIGVLAVDRIFRSEAENI